ncbi:MAG: RsmB/NOP family class I SAM-dependent RNA methyltransferase, partial [Verrucomicrobia bacterium]
MSVAHNQLRIARELWGRLQPLDRHVPVRLQSLLADRRFGSRDRRLYRELLFTALRHARVLATLPATDEVTWAALLAASCAGTRETEAFCAAFAAPGHPVPATSPLDLVPAWFAAEVETGSGLPAPAELAAGLLARAPVWVRQQSPTPDAAIAEWAARGWAAQVHPEVPDA